MSRTILWVIALAGGLLAGGAALWWIFLEDEPDQAKQERTSQPAAESISPAVKPPPG